MGVQHRGKQENNADYKQYTAGNAPSERLQTVYIE